jgi:hypothetical protein
MNQAKRGKKKNARGLAVAIRVSVLVIAATVLAACGDGSGGSGGAAQVSVPNVVGDTQAAATTAITGAKLTVGTVTQASSATVSSGAVISETPAAGTSAASGSSVALVVSTGPATVTVPNVVGDTHAAATTALTGAGLMVGTVTQQPSSSVASGDVISENPAAATSVAKGSAVALVVSSGPRTYTVGGTLIGLAPSAAVHVLNGADSVPISANGSFTLPTAVVSGGNYSITVGTPTSTQTCAVQKGSGTIASANVTNVLVYCTYNVSNATLNNTYTAALANFGFTSSGTVSPLDADSTAVYNGNGGISLTSTVNIAGTIASGVLQSSTYDVITTNAISSLGIEGVNADVIASVTVQSGTPPLAAIAVLPNTNATTTSINGNYTLVDISAQLSSGNMYGYVGTGTLNNGTVTGTYIKNMAGTITTGNPASAQWTVSNGLVTSVGAAQGAVSADGDLIILADTNSGDDPFVNVALRRGTGVTQATFEGVYSVTQYGGLSIATTFGKAITLFAYGDGTFSVIFTKNAQGTITTNNTDDGSYTVAADGTLTLTDSEGNVYNGAISADGNALVLGSVTSNESPAIFVGVRQ